MSNEPRSIPAPTAAGDSGEGDLAWLHDVDTPDSVIDYVRDLTRRLQAAEHQSEELEKLTAQHERLAEAHRHEFYRAEQLERDLAKAREYGAMASVLQASEQRAEAAERQLADLQKDKERLDWIQEHAEIIRDRTAPLDLDTREYPVVWDSDFDGYLREYIDAARTSSPVTDTEA